MTAWTAVTCFMIIASKCALDMIGMEYGSNHQCMSDTIFVLFALLFMIGSIVVDAYNYILSKRTQ